MRVCARAPFSPVTRVFIDVQHSHLRMKMGPRGVGNEGRLPHPVQTYLLYLKYLLSLCIGWNTRLGSGAHHRAWTCGNITVIQTDSLVSTVQKYSAEVQCNCWHQCKDVLSQCFAAMFSADRCTFLRQYMSDMAFHP